MGRTAAETTHASHAATHNADSHGQTGIDDNATRMIPKATATRNVLATHRLRAGKGNAAGAAITLLEELGETAYKIGEVIEGKGEVIVQ